MASHLIPTTKPFRWSKQRARSALLLAENRLTTVEIEAKLGVARKALWAWRQHPEFQARVAAIRERLGEVAQQYAIGHAPRRLAALNERWLAMQRVIAERAADPAIQDVPGGRTGLLVKKRVERRRPGPIPKGELAKAAEASEEGVTWFYAVDTALLQEMRETEKQAAQEVGQWLERKEWRGTGKDGALKVEAAPPPPDVASLTAEDLELIRELRRRLDAQRAATAAIGGRGTGGTSGDPPRRLPSGEAGAP